MSKTMNYVLKLYQESLEAPDGSQRNLEKSFPQFIGDTAHLNIL